MKKKTRRRRRVSKATISFLAEELVSVSEELAPYFERLESDLHMAHRMVRTIKASAMAIRRTK